MTDQILTALKMYLAVSLLGALGVPLCFLVFTRIRGGAVLFARPAMILLTTYVIWIASTLHILPFTGWGIALSALIVLGATVPFILKKREQFLQTLRDDLPIICRGELLFLIVFLVAVFFKMHKSLSYGTEKYMDMALLSSIFRTRWMPPADPWLSGHSINYYYGGYMIFAGLSKLSGISVAVGYNLAIALTFALVAVSVYALVYSLTKSHWLGLLGCALHSWLGNLEAVRQVTRHLLTGCASSLSTSTRLFEWFFSAFHPINLWKTTRVVVDATGGETINEYPLFTFYWGDLHPHLTSMPFVILALGLLWQLMKSSAKGSFGERTKKDLPALIGLSVSIGGLALINGLDFPSFGLLAGTILVLREIGYSRSQTGKNWVEWLATGLGRGVALAVPTLVLAYLLYLPFFLHYEAPVQGDSGMLKKTLFRTDFSEYLLVFGTFFFVILAYAVSQLYFTIKAHESPIGKVASVALVALIVLGFGFDGYVLVPFLVSLILVILYLLFRSLKDMPARVFALSLVAMALGIKVACERVYIVDGYGEGLQRMNTLFKLYLQAWVVLAIACPYLLAEIVRNRKLALGARVGTTVAVVVLCLLGFIITQSMSRQVFDPTDGLEKQFRSLGIRTLNSQEYLKHMRPDTVQRWYTAKEPGGSDEYRAIQWLNSNVQGQPVIVEATGDPYRYYGRVSANTGLPTILGWFNHESVWRKDSDGSIYDQLNERKADVEKIYKSTDLTETLTTLKKYDAKYVYVGPLEREAYPGSGVDKFQQSGWQRAFSGQEVNIYRVPQ